MKFIIMRKLMECRFDGIYSLTECVYTSQDSIFGNFMKI